MGDQSRVASLLTSLRSLAGAVFVLWLLELARAVLRGTADAPELARAAVVSWAELGSFALVLWPVALFAHWWLRRPATPRATYLRAFALLALPTFALVHALTRGRWIRSFVSDLRVELLVAGLLAGLATLLLVELVRGGMPWADRHRRAAALACGLVGAATWELDHDLLPALYPAFHVLCFVVALPCFERAVALLADETPSRKGWGAPILLAAAPFVVVLWPQSSRPVEDALLVELGGPSRTAHVLSAQLWRVGRSVGADDAGPAHTTLPDFGAVEPVDVDVLLVTIDGLNPWLALGDDGPALAPFFASLARRGALFARVYTSYPATEAALSALASAEPHHETRGGPEGARAVSLERFRARGYRTYCDWPFWDRIRARLHAPACDAELVPISKRGRCAEGDECGFDLALRPTAERIALLETFLSAEEAPVFGMVHLLGTHPPYEAPGKSRPSYEDALRATDTVLRELVGWLDARAKPYVLVIGADHGHATGWHGIEGHNSAVYEDQVRVPFLVVGTGVTPGESPGPVSLLDVARALTAPSPAAMVAWLRARAADPGTIVSLRHDDARAAVRGPYKLIESPALGTAALYDVVHDPREQHNLYGERRELASSLAEAPTP